MAFGWARPAPGDNEGLNFKGLRQAPTFRSLRAGDSLGGRSVVYGGVRSATTYPPCELFSLGQQNCTRFGEGGEMTWLPVFEKNLVLSCVEQLFVMLHFSSTQQLEIEDSLSRRG